jgi:hypothetical protein
MAVHHKEILDEVHRGESGVAKFNRSLGIAVTNAVATMWCAYLFAVIALISLPAAIQASFSGGFKPLPIVTWVAQTFLQLVLLAVILFGQKLQSEQADARAEATFRNTKDAETRLGEILTGIAARGEENARMEAQNNEILKRLEGRPLAQG